jgi:hypothetical protein
LANDPSISGADYFMIWRLTSWTLCIIFLETAKRQRMSLIASGYYNVDDTTNGQIVFENNVSFNGTWCFSSTKK